MQQTQGELAGSQTFSGTISPQRVWMGLFTETDGKPSVGEHVSLLREPDAGKPPVRFDERGQETEPSQAGLRWRSESLSQTATGRLTPLRLSSTLQIPPERNPEASKVEESAVGGEQMLMTNQQATELTEPRVGSLHDPAALVAPQFASIFVTPFLVV